MIKPDTERPPEIPPHLWDGIRMFLLEGRETGDFLYAVFCNDLADAIGRADPLSEAALGDIVRWLNHGAPSQAWGSKERVAYWIEHKAEQWRDRQRIARAGR